MLKRAIIEEWLSTLLRIIGAVGLIYETVIDEFKTPTALIVFGGLAGLPDILGYRQSIRSQVEREVAQQRNIEDNIEEDIEKDLKDRGL